MTSCKQHPAVEEQRPDELLARRAERVFVMHPARRVRVVELRPQKVDFDQAYMGTAEVLYLVGAMDQAREQIALGIADMVCAPAEHEAFEQGART